MLVYYDPKFIDPGMVYCMQVSVSAPYQAALAHAARENGHHALKASLLEELNKGLCNAHFMKHRPVVVLDEIANGQVTIGIFTSFDGTPDEYLHELLSSPYTATIKTMEFPDGELDILPGWKSPVDRKASAAGVLKAPKLILLPLTLDIGTAKLRPYCSGAFCAKKEALDHILRRAFQNADKVVTEFRSEEEIWRAHLDVNHRVSSWLHFWFIVVAYLTSEPLKIPRRLRVLPPPPAEQATPMSELAINVSLNIVVITEVCANYKS